MGYLRALVCVWILCGLAGNSVLARPRHWYKDKKFLAGLGVIALAESLDGHSTCRGFSRGYPEGALIGRGNMSCGYTAGVLAVGFGIYTGVHFFDRKYVATGDSRKWDFLGYTEVPMIAGGMHGYAAYHNYRYDKP